MAKFSAIRRAAESVSKLPAAGRRAISRRMIDAATSETRRRIGRRLGPCRTQDVAADVIGDVLGSTAATGFKKDLARYAMGGSESPFLSRVMRGTGEQLRKAIGAIFGRNSPHGVDPAAMRKAEELLKDAGYEIRKPGQRVGRPIPLPKPTAGPKPVGPVPSVGGPSGLQPPTPPTRQPPPQVPPRQPPRGPGGFPIAEAAEGPPVPHGAFPGQLAIQMKHVIGSSNVYAYGYDADTMTLRVQFLGSTINRGALRGRGHRGRKRVRGTLGSTVAKGRRGPGPVYDYHSVPERVYKYLDNAGSKGKAVWDKLRIRGTVHGHRFDYELVAASVVDVIVPSGKKVARLTYVPRKAVGLAHGKTGFIGRTITQGAGPYKRRYRSVLPNQGRGRRVIGG